MRGGLTPYHAKHLLACLRDDARRLSPAVGLVAASAAAHAGNLLRLAECDSVGGTPRGIRASAALSAELLFRASRRDPIVPTRSASQAAFHLTPRRWGALLGLAIAGATRSRFAEDLGNLGIGTNRVDGAWTGVSMARYLKLADLAAAAWHDEGGTLAPLLASLWARSSSKRDLLDFLLAVDAYFPVFAPGWEGLRRGDPQTVDRFLASAFSKAEVLALDPASIAASLLSSSSSPADLETAELVSCSLSQTQAYKQPVPVLRHPYRGGKDVPDCVEVAVREFFEFVLFDTEAQRLDASLLPPTTRPEVRAFFSSPPAGELPAARAWFEMLQGLEACDYISSSPAGAPYELHPDSQTLARVIGWALGAPGWRSWTRMADASAFWNSLHPSASLSCTERIDAVKSVLHEDTKRRELSLLSRPGAPVSLEIALHAAHRTATCTYRRVGAHAAAADPGAREGLLHGWARGELAPWADVHAALILGDRMLESLRRRGRVPDRLAAQALLAARWGPDRLAWQPLEHAARTAGLLDADVHSECRRGAGMVVTGARVAADVEERGLGRALAVFAGSEAGEEDADIGGAYLDHAAVGAAVKPLLEGGWEPPDTELWRGAKGALGIAGGGTMPRALWNRARCAWLARSRSSL
ncbi:hypothetical protein DFJ74DRAFT_409604 [Hyaloraphidium curvatum]|nr:hypothetical protein DFJ74DRAFT_409604 [Hyaloraphidium curvatum]